MEEDANEALKLEESPVIVEIEPNKDVVVPSEGAESNEVVETSENVVNEEECGEDVGESKENKTEEKEKVADEQEGLVSQDTEHDKETLLESADEGVVSLDTEQDKETLLESANVETDKCLNKTNKTAPLTPSNTLEDSEDDGIDEENINVNIDDPKQKILWAAEKNEVDVVRQLLEEEPTLVDARDEDMYTPLHRACSNNHIEIIKLLLTSGADLGARTEDGWCPLHCACRWDSVEAASLLLQNGANVNATSKGGLAPLHLAAANSSGRRTLELLLWHPHLDGSLRAENGDTAYDIACRTSNTLLRLFELLDESVNCF